MLGFANEVPRPPWKGSVQFSQSTETMVGKEKRREEKRNQHRHEVNHTIPYTLRAGYGEKWHHIALNMHIAVTILVGRARRHSMVPATQLSHHPIILPWSIHTEQEWNNAANGYDNIYGIVTMEGYLTRSSSSEPNLALTIWSSREPRAFNNVNVLSSHIWSALLVCFKITDSPHLIPHINRPLIAIAW